LGWVVDLLESGLRRKEATSMSVYQRGDNWYIDFTFKGQRIRESIGPSRKDADKVIAKKKTEIVENKYLDIRKEPDPIKFHEFAKEYLKWAKTNKKASTDSRDISIMRGLDREFEGKNIQDVTSWLIEKWKSKRAEKFKPGSVNRELALLKHVFSKALEWKRIKENPAPKVKRLKGAARRVRYLMPDEIQTFLSHCEGLLRGLLKPMVTVALHTGARKGELQGLEWSNVNFDLGFISLLVTKNGERRDIPMNETVRATLKAMERASGFVFPNRNGKRIDNCALYLAFYEALEKSKIEDFRFHDLRHTFASNLVMQEGVELNDVRELLGHKKMEMTLRYAHLSPKHKGKVVNILDGVMSQNPPQAEKVVQLM
jgi:integrase